MDENIALTPCTLIDAKEIWCYAQHNAFCDLEYFQGRWYCTFRESDSHEKGQLGTIRIIRSRDGHAWESAGYFEDPEADLRDPKLCIDPEGRLMLLIGSVHFDEDYKYVFRESLVAFSTDGVAWGLFKRVTRLHDWLWRITWHKGVAYGVSYWHSNLQNLKKEWFTTLWRSPNGLDFEELTTFKIRGRPNETTLRFMPDGEMIALVRRNKRKFRGCCIGRSKPPYTKWKWEKTKVHLGGPNFLITPEGMVASGRMMFPSPYGRICKTAVTMMSDENIYPRLILPSDGDTGYSGMVMREGILWISYHSSPVSDRTGIWLARVTLGTGGKYGHEIF